MANYLTTWNILLSIVFQGDIGSWRESEKEKNFTIDFKFIET